MKIQAEINSLEKALAKLEEKYTQQPSKTLYDTIITLQLTIKSAKQV